MDGTLRERRGQLVRETVVTWAKRQRRPDPAWMTGWDRLSDDKREACMLIADAVAEAATADLQRAVERAETLLAERDRQRADLLVENGQLRDKIMTLEGT